MKRLTLWLLRLRLVGLEEQLWHGEALLRETRARLQHTHAELRRTRQRVAELTPAHRLLKEAMTRRDAEIRRPSSGREQPTLPLASRQRNVYR